MLTVLPQDSAFKTERACWPCSGVRQAVAWIAAVAGGAGEWNQRQRHVFAKLMRGRQTGHHKVHVATPLDSVA